MNIFDGFEKLINEHGSAAILREHLSLMKTQFAILEREKAELKSENQTLKKENSNLKAENDKLQKKIRDYEKNEGGFSSGVIIS